MKDEFEKDMNEDIIEESESYPVMPLRNTVLFPQQVIPIYIGREKSLKLINEVPASSKHIVVVAQEDGSIEDPNPDEMYSFGTLAVVLKVFDMPDNSKSAIVQGIDRVKILSFKDGTKFQVLAPTVRSRNGQFKDVLRSIAQEGFVRVRIDGEEKNLSNKIDLEKNIKHNIEVLIDRLVSKKGIKDRLTGSIELALKVGNGLVIIDEIGKKEHLYSEYFSCPKCDISFEELKKFSKFKYTLFIFAKEIFK